MTANRAYQKYLLKTQENGTNDNLAVSRDRFVALFNEAQNKYVEWHLDKRNSDERRNIQFLLEIDKEVTNSTLNQNHYDFSLPEDYFDFSNAYCLASKGDCSNQRINIKELKDENLNELLRDEFYRPSFEYRESLYQIVGDKLIIYTDDFNITKLLLSYYRYPQQLRLENPNNPESRIDDNYSPEFDDKVVDRIISIAAGDYDLDSNNPRVQLQKQRVVSKF